MSRALGITGEYPADWKAVSDRVWAEAGHRCIRCLHPYKKGEHGKGEWTPCDEHCNHRQPLANSATGEGTTILYNLFPLYTAGEMVKRGSTVFAQWRIGTVHHFDGNKANCVWWNLLALCQRCHLKTQARVDPQVPYILEHSVWLKPYVAGFYAAKYLNEQLTREQVMARLDELLALERIA